MEWKLALQKLKEGNQRFVSCSGLNKRYKEQELERLAIEQKPFAVVVTCSDSRISPEIVFDQQLGSIFTIKNAGSIVDETVLGSIEFAVGVLGSPLIIVMSHTRCGAVQAAIDEYHADDKLTGVINHIRPAIAKDLDVHTITQNHVFNMANKVENHSLVKEYHAQVVPAIYHIETGVIEWLVQS